MYQQNVGYQHQKELLRWGKKLRNLQKYDDADTAAGAPGYDPGYDLSDDSGVGLRVLIILFSVERGDKYFNNLNSEVKLIYSFH